MFEHSLIDLEAKQQPRRRRWISLPIAVALHLVGIAAFAFASYWNVGTVTEPSSLNVAFIDVMLPPPPPSGGGGRPKPPMPKPEDAKPPVVTPDKPVQPTDETVPDKPPARDTTDIQDLGPSTDDDSPNTDGPVGPGDGPGVGPGTGPGTDEGPIGNGDAPGVGDDEPIHLTVGMTRPEPIHRVTPSYTEAARRAGIQGTAFVEATIDEKGNVTDVHVVRGLPMGLDRKAVEAVQQWRFKPAMRGDKPVKVYFMLTVHFTIQR